MTRIPSLDGLRALSILAVVLGHLTGTNGFPDWVGPALVNPYVDVAELGVRVFFVISGFLITRLLLEEKDATGGTDLRRFYRRRALRILPAYLAFLGAVVALDAAGLVEVNRNELTHAFTFTMNYAHRPIWTVGHLWSLSVEEQFYLLWPPVLVLAGRRRAAIIALAVVCVVPFIRLAAMLSFQPVRSFQTTADAIALGCLMALWAPHLATSPRLRRLAQAWWPAVVLLAMSAGVGTMFGLVPQLTQDALANVACAAFVAFCVTRPGTLLGRALNTRPLVFVGALSYSLYLWQQLFIDRTSRMPGAFPMNIGLAVAWALISYYGVERPFLRLRRWLEDGRPPRVRALGTVPVSR